MDTKTHDRMPPSLLTAKEGDADMLQSAADALMQKAAAARAKGDNEAAAKLLRAMANILGSDELEDMPATRGSRSGVSDGRRKTTLETEKIKAMLREGWREAHELQDATGLNANRVHSLLGRLKNSRELKFEKRVITQYRLAD